jgi:DNA-binding HxlR family transcriptional regulator
MKRGFSEWPCSLARAVEVFGDSWTLLIVRDGLQGLTRFDEFQRSLNVARNTLSDRLGKLVDAGVMTKRFYQDNPPRYEYLLTEMGRDFFPVLAAMLSWGDKWLDDGGGAPVTLHHHKPGHTIVSQVVCSECGEPVVHADIEFCVGPGYPDDVSPELDIRGRLTPAPGQSAGYSLPDAKSSPATAGEVPEGSAPEGSAPGGSCDADGVGKDTRANGGEVSPRKRATPKRTRPAQPSRRAG